MRTYLVINVCNVHDKLDVKAKVVLEDAPNDVGRYVVARMSQMALVVDGRSADIPRHLAGLNRLEGHRRAGLQRAVNLERLHGS